MNGESRKFRHDKLLQFGSSLGKDKALKVGKGVSEDKESGKVPMAKVNKISVDVVKAPEKMTVPKKLLLPLMMTVIVKMPFPQKMAKFQWQMIRPKLARFSKKPGKKFDKRTSVYVPCFI